MLETPLVEYHFESYKDLNGGNAIRFRLSDADGNNYSFDGAPGKLKEQKLSGANIPFSSDVFTNFKEESGCFSWNSYRTSFKLTTDGNLNLSKINQDYNPSFKINGAKVVTLGGQNFKQLHIVSKEINFVDDCAIGDLQVSASTMLNKSTLNAETANISASTIANPGKIQASKTAEIKSVHFDNRHGGVHAGVAVKLTTEHLQNEQGNLSGINSTSVEIGKSLTNNEHSEIGVSGKTTVTFKNNIVVEKLGIIRGEQVQLINPAVVKSQGIIAANQEVLLTSPDKTVVMPKVDIQTPVLKLQTPNFQLGDQTHCDRTILQTTVGRSVTLINEYRTTGTFEFQEPNITPQNIQQIMQQRFGDIANYKVANLPNAKYNISIRASIQADQGITALTPNAKLCVGVNGQPNHPELLAQSGDLTAYVTEFDIEKGGAAAKNAFIWAPKGFPLGRLIEDPNRQAFATFYAHAHYSHSTNLGSYISPISYTFLGNNVSVYDGRHLLTMPIAIGNGSFLQIKGSTKIIGKFNHQGNLKTRNLTIDSTSDPSIWEAGVAHVEKDCELIGKFTLQRTTTVFNTKHSSCGSWGTWAMTFCNSDPAQLLIQGKLSGNAIITNEASYLHAKEKGSEVQINSKDFTSYWLHQQFIGGSLKERQALSTAVGNGWGIHANSINADGCLPYATGFLAKTNNFKDSQRVFPAQTSFNSAVVLPTRNSQLEGMLTAPKMLITLGGKLALGSPNPYYINPKNPIRDLMSKGFNLHTTYYMPEEIKKLIEQSTVPKFHFLFRERFWFNEKESQDFYQSIFEHIVIKNGDGSFTKPKPQTVFSLSPNYLIDRIREECEEVLMRGYIYEGRPIDHDLIKELHKNTTKYLKATNGSGKSFQQALVVAGTGGSIKAPPKPMLYYQAFMNDQQGLEVLSPYLYIPEAMINEVRAQHGGLVKTNVLFMLPENLTPKELIDFVKDRPALQTSLIKFFNSNPNAKKYLHNNAITMKAQQKQHQLTVSTQAISREVVTSSANGTESGVTMGGTIQAKKLAVIAKGGVVVNGQLETEDALLASLFDDVEIKSIIERSSSQENFDDTILSQARVHAANILQIFAGKNVIFEGAETDSGVMTQVQALANILDVPIALIHQRVQHFYGKTHGSTKDVYVEQSSSSHKSGGDICMAAREKAVLYAPKFTAQKLQVVGGQSAAILDATEQRIHEEQFTSEEDTWYGGTSTESSSMARSATSSKGAELNVKQLEVAAGEGGIKLRNTNSTAERNLFYTPEGEVEFLAGREDFISSSASSSSDPFWTESESTTVKRTSWSGCNIPGQIEIHAKNVTLEMVRGATSDLLQKIEQGLGGRGTITCILKEEYCSIESDYHEAPGPALIGLVALATSIITYGTCTTWAVGLGFAKGTVGCAMATAGFSSLCSQAAAQIVANNGDPLKAIKALASEDTVKSLAVSMISAGALHKACELLKIPELGERKIFEHMQYNLARASVSATLNMSINKRDPEQALLDGLVDAAIGTALAPVTSQIDDWYNLGEISAINHKIVHGVIGAAKGALRHDGAIAGALEGVTGAVLHDLFDEKRPAKKEKALDQPKSPDKPSATVKPQNPDQQEQEMREKEQLQYEQAELLDNMKRHLDLQNKIAVETTGTGLDVETALTMIETKINGMTREQIKEVSLALDTAKQRGVFVGDGVKMQPACAQLLLPIARIFGPPVLAYLIGKAGMDTYEIFQKYQQQDSEQSKGMFFSRARTYPTTSTTNSGSGANLDGSNGDQNDDDDKNRHGGGKNAPHANKNARNSAKEKYETAKADYERLKKLYKTEEIIKQRDAAKRQMEHWKRKMDFSGESHSQKPKGGGR